MKVAKCQARVLRYQANQVLSESRHTQFGVATKVFLKKLVK